MCRERHAKRFYNELNKKEKIRKIPSEWQINHARNVTASKDAIIRRKRKRAMAFARKSKYKTKNKKKKCVCVRKIIFYAKIDCKTSNVIHKIQK